MVDVMLHSSGNVDDVACEMGDVIAALRDGLATGELEERLAPLGRGVRMGLRDLDMRRLRCRLVRCPGGSLALRLS